MIGVVRLRVVDDVTARILMLTKGGHSGNERHFHTIYPARPADRRTPPVIGNNLASSMVTDVWPGSFLNVSRTLPIPVDMFSCERSHSTPRRCAR
jgi:hypothetical protein